MEEEDLSFSNLLFLQSANNPNPKQQKKPKTNTSKCNCNPSSSITQQKNPHTLPYKHQGSRQILQYPMLKIRHIQHLPKLHKHPKNKHID